MDHVHELVVPAHCLGRLRKRSAPPRLQEDDLTILITLHAVVVRPPHVPEAGSHEFKSSRNFQSSSSTYQVSSCRYPKSSSGVAENTLTTPAYFSSTPLTDLPVQRTLVWVNGN